MHYLNLQKFQIINNFNINTINKDTTNLSIIYRNYSKTIKSEDLIKIKNFCKKKGIKFYISNKINECLKYNLDGLYIPSFNKQNIIKKLNLHRQTIIGSAHNHIEIREKINQGCKIIFLSPLFKIKKNKKSLGVCRLNLLTLNYKVRFVALGGIKDNNYKLLKMINIHGMAGIRYFKKKPASNEAGFNKE